ncbi:MAG: hypothetical protein ACM3N9_07265 [Syntrophothermus sp.]
MSRKILIAVFILFLFIPSFNYAQCCSTGSPVGASVNVGVLSRKNLRVILFYRNSYSDRYYKGNEKTENTFLKNAYYNFSGITFGYGITRRLTAEADFGYFFNKTQVLKINDYAETGYGLSNGGLTFKYGFVEKPLRQIELVGGIGVRYPFSFEPQMKDGHTLNPDVQPSTHAFGISGLVFFNKGFPDLTLRIFSINKYDYNFANQDNYRYGNILMNSVFASKKIVNNLFGILQIRSEWKSHDYYESLEGNILKRENSGYELVTVTPQISYSIAGKWNLSVLYDIPVYKYYNYSNNLVQLTPRYSFAVSLSHDFNLGPKIK